MQPRPVKPESLSAPGLNWRRRKDGWVAYWICRTDIAERGYSLKSVRLWPPSAKPRPEPDVDEWLFIGSQCDKLQAEMLEWGNCGPANWDPRTVYDGTVATLIDVYQRDPDSPYQELRLNSKKGYDSKCKSVKIAVGAARVPELNFRDFKRWYEGFCKAGADGKARKARGHGLMTQVRIVFAFGSLLKLPGCREAKDTLSEMEFSTPKRRTVIITYEQVLAVIAEAHRRGVRSIALAQSIMWDMGVRQKDAIGEWSPFSEPGISDVTDHGDKWLFGMRLDNIVNGILTHRLSKSLRGRNAVADPEAGKVKRFDLTLYPLVMQEMAFLGERRTGPMVIAEHTGLPWRQKVFAEKWREIARAAGVPDNVQNRDSRAGAATEADIMGIPLEETGKALGHAKPDTTRIYTRGEDAITAKVAILRTKNRPQTS